MKELTHTVHGFMMVVLSAGVIALVYLAWVVLWAWRDSKDAPKSDMFTCDKHGLVPVKYVMSLPIDDGGPPHLQCPFCFEDAIKRADELMKVDEARRMKVK